MANKARVSSEMIQAALDAAEKARTPDDLRMAQSVLIPKLLNVSDEVTGQIIGRSRITVARLRQRFREVCSGRELRERSRGGRRYGYMTLEEERRFLSRFLEEASHGGVLIVSEIKVAFEALVGHEVAKTTVYRMLERHGWRKIAPRPRHPKTEPEAMEGFKKTPKDRRPVR